MENNFEIFTLFFLLRSPVAVTPEILRPQCYPRAQMSSEEECRTYLIKL